MSPSPTPQPGQPSPNSPLGHPTHLIPTTQPPPQPPKICLDPVDLDFGTMDPNTSKTLQKSVRVRNCGGQQLHWSTGGGGLVLDVKEKTLDSDQSQLINVTLHLHQLYQGYGYHHLHLTSTSGIWGYLPGKAEKEQD